MTSLSEFVRHIPCTTCGSSDANSLYSDGHEFCFACGAYAAGEASAVSPQPARRMAADLIQGGEVKALHTRKLDAATCAKYGYVVGNHRGRSVQIAPYYAADGSLVAQKIRDAEKNIWSAGNMDEALPFGAHVWPRTGKMVVVTEGEIDALSVSQAQGNKWPVVSIGCGAGPQIKKYMAKHLEYWRGFEKVVLMFDMDEPGQKAVKEAAEVIGPRAMIAKLPLKDANEMLVAGRVEELLNAMWRAEPYRPEGIVDILSLKDQVFTPPTLGLSWFSPTLTRLTFGKKTKRIYTFGAGTGVGKTDFFTQDMAHMVLHHGEPIGVFSLEQSVAETATRIIGKLGHKAFHVPDETWTPADKEAAWSILEESAAAGAKVWLYDHFGVQSWESIAAKIEWLRHTHGVKWFYLDHLTALAAGEDDEKTALERIMAEMGGMVQRLDIAIHLVSHLATPEGKPHEEGGRVMIRHFKGSRAIGFWSTFMFGLERNQQAEDPTEKNTTTFRILKDRDTGRATGETFYLGYDHATASLYETVAPEKQSARTHGFRDETADVGGADF